MHCAFTSGGIDGRPCSRCGETLISDSANRAEGCRRNHCGRRMGIRPKQLSALGLSDPWLDTATNPQAGFRDLAGFQAKEVGEGSQGHMICSVYDVAAALA